jgi:LCP family protein required for cell wall assembly
VNERPYSVYRGERLLRRRRRRVLLGSAVGVIVLIVAIAGGSYLWAHAQWQKTQITDPDVIAALTSEPAEDLYPTPEGSMNILVLGIDHVGGTAIRSDSMMLVHTDPENGYLSILSLPRDLRVEVPGEGTQKLNYAYAHGGAELAIQTAEALTGVDVTQYLEVDFNAFKSLTEAVGGVYVDVDRHYLNLDTKYEMIDVRAGYQLLNGEDALDYVRYRIDENMDFGRQQRQQRFISALREQAMGWDLGLKLPGLVTALTSNIQTTVTFEQFLSLAYWAVTKLDGGRIRQITIVGAIKTIEGVSYVVPGEGKLEQAVVDFVTPPAATTTGQTTVATGSTAGSTDTTGTTGTTVPASEPVDSSQFITDPNRIADSSLWRQIAAGTPFSVMAPGYLPEGYVYHERNPEGGGGYDIDTGNGTAKGLKMVYQLIREDDPYDQYLGIMETTWLEAPAASAGRQFAYSGITYTVVGTANNTERIWWQKDGVLYWVSNTISHYLASSELVKVATSMMAIQSGAAD